MAGKSLGELMSQSISSPIQRKRVCLVAEDSQTFSRLLKQIDQDKYEVTIVTLSPFKLVGEGFKQVFIAYSGPTVSSLLPAVQAYHLLGWMLEHSSDFDLILFPLERGVGYYTLLAKHQGWAFQEVEFFVDCSSSTLLDKHKESQWIEYLDELAADYLERESFALADCAIIQDQSVRKWVEERQWKRPSRVISPADQLSLMDLFALSEKNKKSFSLSEETKEQPLVSVCVTHFNRPHYLSEALESIRAQNYSHFEVILVDDGSTTPEAIAYLNQLEEEFQAKGWKIIRNPANLFPGAARNIAARNSRGDYLLFMDDDNYAKANEIATFIKVAQNTQADILTCAMDVFTTIPGRNREFSLIHRFVPMGAAVGLGLYVNLFGDMNALIKKEVYEALKGLTEERGVGGEDWELFSRATLQGYHLETIPLPLFWYRDTPGGITKSTHLYANSLRGIRPYLDSVPLPLRSNLILSQAQQEKLACLLRERNDIFLLLRHSLGLFYLRAKRALTSPRKTLKRVFSLLLKI